MKRILLILTGLVIVNALFSNDFQNANIEFADGNYNSAVELYKSDILKNGDSFNTLFNLGNAYYEAEKRGMALYYLKKAYIINPRNRDLNQLIDIVENDLNIESSGKLLKIPVSPREIQTLLTISLLLLSLVLFLVALLVFLDKKENWFYNIKKHLVISAASLTFILVLLNFYNISNKKWGIVQNSSKVLISPYNESDESFSINEGTPVKLGEHFQDYYFITDAGERYGWIHVDSVGTYWKK